MATTAQKNIERQKLEELVRSEAFYVQLAMKNDLATLLSSGFEPVGGRSPSEPLGAPVVLKIDNIETTRLALKVTPVPNARAYEVRKMNGTGGWVPAVIGTKSRWLEVADLVPGSTYQLQVGRSAAARARARGAIRCSTWRRKPAASRQSRPRCPCGTRAVCFSRRSAEHRTPPGPRLRFAGRCHREQVGFPA